LGAFMATPAAWAARESFQIDPSVHIIEPLGKPPSTKEDARASAPGASATHSAAPTGPQAHRVAVVYQTMAQAAAAGVNPLAKKPSEVKGPVSGALPPSRWRTYGMWLAAALAALGLALVAAWAKRRHGLE
jgi:hypothetical protein